MIDLQSILGYSKGSPFAGNPYLDINTPEGLIDMSETDIDLWGIDNKGNKKRMKAGRKKPYKFQGNIVREIPMQGGGSFEEITGIKPIKSLSNVADNTKNVINIDAVKEDPKTNKNVTVYATKDKTTSDYLNTLTHKSFKRDYPLVPGVNVPDVNKFEEFNGDYYEDTWQAWLKNGKPSIVPLEGTEGRSYFVPTSNWIQKLSNKSGRNQMNLNYRSDNPYSVRDAYLAELAHAQQELKGIRSNDRKKWSTNDEYDSKAYTTPGAHEYEAHEVIQPKLENRYSDRHSLVSPRTMDSLINANYYPSKRGEFTKKDFDEYNRRYDENLKKLIWKQKGGNIKAQQGGLPKVKNPFGDPRDLARQNMARTDESRVSNIPVQPISSDLRAVSDMGQANKISNTRELARRKQAIAKSKLNPSFRNSAAGEKLRFFPDDPNSFVDEYLNPFKMVGDMADNIGHTVGGDATVGQQLLSVATPLTLGALGSIGAKSTGQFVNNMANPFAGIGSKKDFSELYSTVKDRISPTRYALSGDEEKLLSTVRNLGHITHSGNVYDSQDLLSTVMSKADRLPDREFESLTGWRKTELQQRLDDLKANNINNTSKKTSYSESDLDSGADFDMDTPELSPNNDSELSDAFRIATRNTEIERLRAQFRGLDIDAAVNANVDITPGVIRHPLPDRYALREQQAQISQREIQSDAAQEYVPGTYGVQQAENQLPPPPSEIHYDPDGWTSRQFRTAEGQPFVRPTPADLYAQALSDYFLKPTKKETLVGKLNKKLNPYMDKTSLPMTESLIPSLAKNPTNNPAREIIKAYNIVKASEKGKKFIPAHSLSTDSYPISLSLMKRALDDDLIDVGYHGFDNLNKMGFSQTANLPNSVNLNEINSMISNINKTRKGKSRLPYAKLDSNGEYINAPVLTVTRKNKGGYMEKGGMSLSQVYNFLYDDDNEDNEDIPTAPSENEISIQQSTVNPSTEENPYTNRKSGNKAQYAFQFFKGRGLADHQAAGIVANLIQESGNFRDDVISGEITGDNNLKDKAYGVAQWRGDRYKNLVSFAQNEGMNPYTLDAQLRFVEHEAKQRGDWNKLKQTTNLGDATHSFNYNYEVSADSRNPKLKYLRTKHVLNKNGQLIFQ